MTMTDIEHKNPAARSLTPWLWVPTLYFAEGIPYFVVNIISVIMFKRLGMGNAEVALYTGLLYLPWVIKPLWSPFVDIIRTKRWWIVAAQVLITVALAAAALSVLLAGHHAVRPCIADTPSTIVPAPGGASATTDIPTSVPAFTITLVIFWITAFASATHDIAADGFYMLALSGGAQSLFVGIRSLFYRLSSVFGQGVLVVIAGLLETRTGDIPLAWTLTLAIAALIFAAITFYHTLILPRPDSDSPRTESQTAINPGNRAVNPDALNPGSRTVNPDACQSAGHVAFKSQSRRILAGFARTFTTFFRKKGILPALLFLLLYRLPEALLLKMLNPFLLDPASQGGLGLSTETVGIVYGTVGVLALTLGGILGGVAASRWGLRKSLLPMALCLALPCAVYVLLSFLQPTNLLTINACVAIDQFGYGFGFTAYSLYMMYWSEGEFKTSHFSLCTAFMALSMMLPGMVAGYLQQWLGYRGFFILVVACCLVTVAVTLSLRVDPGYGKYRKTETSD